MRVMTERMCLLSFHIYFPNEGERPLTWQSFSPLPMILWEGHEAQKGKRPLSLEGDTTDSMVAVTSVALGHTHHEYPYLQPRTLTHRG